MSLPGGMGADQQWIEVLKKGLITMNEACSCVLGVPLIEPAVVRKSMEKYADMFCAKKTD